MLKNKACGLDDLHDLQPSTVTELKLKENIWDLLVYQICSDNHK